MRPILIALHKYAGLLAGLLLSLTGLTGSALVFDHALDELVAPETVAFAPNGEQASLQSVVDSARAALGGEADAERIYLPRKEGSAHVVRFPGPPGAPGPVEVSVAPTTAEVLAVRTWGDYPMSWLYRLHYTLLAGDTGKTIVGVFGLLLIFFCISGVVIWWPRSGPSRAGRWRRALTIKPNGGAFRFNYDLHKTAGIYFLPLLLAVSFSGVALVFHAPVEKMVSTVMPMDKRPGPKSVGQGQGISIDRAVAIGQQVFPEASLKRVYMPRGEEGSYHLAFNQAGEAWSNHAATALWVDQYSGEVLDIWDATRLAAGSNFMQWQFPLHNGDALGIVGRWLVFVTGLLPALFFGTGLYMWLRKRQLGKARLRNDKSAVAGTIN
ncbi:PepSY domain-containing protein [Proteobacteria bacterium 005FR1]|nr:PepSY domain-containing protein [Proteobacteria bacterium 005FR1]